MYHAPMTLEEYIKNQGLSQKEAAQKFMVSEGMISRLLSKQRKPRAALKFLISQKTKGAVGMDSWK